MHDLNQLAIRIHCDMRFHSHITSAVVKLILKELCASSLELLSFWLYLTIALNAARKARNVDNDFYNRIILYNILFSIRNNVIKWTSVKSWKLKMKM